MSQPKVFFFHLANGHSWQFVSDETCQGLTERLVALAELRTVGRENAPRVIMSHDEPLLNTDGSWRVPQSVSRLTGDIPRDGWNLQSMGHMRLMSHQDCEDHICAVRQHVLERHLIPTLRPAFIPVFRGVQQEGGLVAHSALFARDEQGVLLVGPSGMGKSTCARRVGQPWAAFCDDQVLVVKVREGSYECHPLPTWSSLWSDSQGRSWDVNRHVPLKAVFFLERSEVNKVEPIGQGRAVALLSNSARSMATTREIGTNRHEEMALTRMLFDNACGLVKSAPCFVLHANLTTRFWEQMDSVM
jgi:SynChlorMet cassette protein ScmC